MSASPLQELIALAQEPSSGRRRELLRRVTDIFLEQPCAPTPAEDRAFDGLFCALVEEMELEIRQELSSRFAHAAHAPAELAGRLARDCIEVALPILTNAKLLSEVDLLDVARTLGQDHLRAVSARPGLSEAVSDVIVERGDDETLGVLVRNDGAALSRQASETVVARASANPELQAAAVERQNLPLDLLNEMYLFVESRLRDRIRARNQAADPAALETALQLARTRMTARAAAPATDLAEAIWDVEKLEARHRLTPQALLAFLREGRSDHFAVGLARLADIDAPTVRNVVERRDFDALAIVCKAVEIERAMFLTFAVLTSGDREAISRASTYSKLYQELPRDTAQRTLRFWRIRCEGGEAAAA